MKRRKHFLSLPILLGAALLFATAVTAADKVVVVPLGGTVGNATPVDVIKGKTFSSKTAGKGATGTLEQHPMGQSYTNTNGMTFNLIPAGTFTMGSPDGSGSVPAEPGRWVRETQHQVTLTKSFYVQITEVTNKQWDTVIVATRIGVNPSTSHTGVAYSVDTYPVETVNWFEAAYFANQLSIIEGKSSCYTLNGCDATVPGAGMTCTSVDIRGTCTGYQLPTEAQWEYAARATTTTAYANPVNFDTTNTEIYLGFNSNLSAMGWYLWNDTNGGYASGTKPVAAKQANYWGLYDMHGNVREWCRDWSAVSDYSPAAVTDPTGGATGTYRVFRSGSWGYVAGRARSAARNGLVPGSRIKYLGFRLVLPSGQ